MYGGTWRRSTAWVVALALPATMAGCQDERPARADDPAREAPARSVEANIASAADYERWEPSYRDVRPAIADDMAVLRDRIVDLNASSYTARVSAMDLEIARSPTHVRVTLPSFVAAVVPYSSFEEGVPDGYDAVPEPIPYGTTPSPTPSPTPLPTSTSPTDGMQTVLVAVEEIEAGTSLVEVQQTARLDLAFVAAGQLVPGAVDSTSDLDGVATRDIHEGDQITDDSFD